MLYKNKNNFLPVVLSDLFRKYTRYLTFGWAIILSTSAAFFLVKPLVFNWSLILALKIIISLSTGSMLSVWFAEQITNENLGNGSSMIIFINIIGGIPTNFNEFVQTLNNNSGLKSLQNIGSVLLIYLTIVSIIIRNYTLHYLPYYGSEHLPGLHAHQHWK